MENHGCVTGILRIELRADTRLELNLSKLSSLSTDIWTLLYRAGGIRTHETWGGYVCQAKL